MNVNTDRFWFDNS